MGHGGKLRGKLHAAVRANPAPRDYRGCQLSVVLCTLGHSSGFGGDLGGSAPDMDRGRSALFQGARDESARNPFSRHDWRGGQIRYYQSLRPPHRCQESDPDTVTVAAPSAKRQRVCESKIGPKFTFTVDVEGVVRNLPGTMGPILVGKKCSKGQTRTPHRPWPDVMRSATRRGGGSRSPLLLLTVSAQHVPP